MCFVLCVFPLLRPLNKYTTTVAGDQIASAKAVIRACQLAGETEEAIQLVKETLVNGIACETAHYNVALKAHAEREEWVEAVDLLREINAATATAGLGPVSASGAEIEADLSWKPDATSYNTVIAACTRAGQEEMAVELLREMSELGISGDSSGYTTAILACSENGRWKLASTLLGEMRRARHKPDKKCYTAALTACWNAQQWDNAATLWTSMLSDGVEADTVLYSMLISALGSAGKWEEAVNILERMRDVAGNTPRPSLACYNSAITACATAREPEVARDLLRRMKMDGTPRPDAISYSIAIRAQASRGRWQQAVELIKEMGSDGLIPDKIAYRLTISACRNADQEELANTIASAARRAAGR